jgi:hypothetical protein
MTLRLMFSTPTNSLLNWQIHRMRVTEGGQNEFDILSSNAKGIYSKVVEAWETFDLAINDNMPGSQRQLRAWPIQQATPDKRSVTFEKV